MRLLTASIFTLGVVLGLAAPTLAQSEFFPAGSEVYSAGWYDGEAALGVKQGHAADLDVAVALSPVTMLSFGLGRMRPTGGLADVHTLSVGVSYLTNRTPDASPVTAELGVGIHYGSGNPNEVLAGRLSAEVAAAAGRRGVLHFVPWIGGSSDVILSGAGELSSVLTAGLGVGVQARRDLVIFVRPGYRVLTFGDTAPGFGVTVGIAVID